MGENRATVDRIQDGVFPSLQGRCRYSPREAPPPVLSTPAQPNPTPKHTHTETHRNPDVLKAGEKVSHTVVSYVVRNVFWSVLDCLSA